MIPKYLQELFQQAQKKYKKTPHKNKNLEYFTPLPIQKKWVDWCFSGGERLLLGARGYGKTESVILYGLFSRIMNNKKLTARIYSRNYEDAQDLLRALGYLLQQAGCTGVFTSKQIILSENKKKEPTVSLKSILGKGHKGKHVDWVIFDDPVDIMDEFSPILIKRVKNIYENLSSIAKKGVITIGQYVCYNDLYCELEKKIPTQSYWYGCITQLDVSLEELRKNGRTEHFINANYLGVLLPSHNHPFERLQVGKFGNKYEAACLDPSLTGGDYTALAMMRQENRDIYIRVYLWKASYIDCWEEICETLYKTGISTLSYEDNIVGDVAYLTFNKIPGLKVYPFYSHRNKVHKIMQLEPFIKPNALSHFRILFDEDSNPKALEQIRFWNPLQNSHDDAPDSVAMLLQQEGLIP